MNFTMYYAKEISGHFKLGKKEEGLKIVSEFWKANVGKVKGLKGFMLMLDPCTSEIATNITVWENKQYMDEYYSGDVSYFAVLDKIQQMMDGELERHEYTVLDYGFSELIDQAYFNDSYSRLR